jgi:hypothetical protein
MLTVHLIAVLLSQTPDSALGDVGESCRARSDCRSGLRCVNAQCTAPVAQTREGQACEATSDCSSDGSLRCVARVCRARGSVSMAPDTSSGSSTARLMETPPPPPRSASLMDAPPPPPPSPAFANNTSVSQQIMALERDIDTINFDLRRIQTGWPAGSIALVVIGALISPLTLIGLLILPASVIVGIVVLGVGAGGIAMIVAGAMGGSKVASDAMAERNELLERRSNAERELANLRRTAGIPPRANSAMLTVASF